MSNRPIGYVRVKKATPRDMNFPSRLPWYEDRIGKLFRVYLDGIDEYPLVNPKKVGDAYAVIYRCDAEFVRRGR